MAKRHPRKQVAEAIGYALERGWRLLEAGGHAHAFGTLRCPEESREGHRYTVSSTPRSADAEAARIRRFVDRCQHPRRSEMKTYSFTLVIEGVEVTDLAFADAIYGAGLDDANTGYAAGVNFIEVDREAASYAEALSSAVRQVRAAVPQARVVRVEPDGLVSLQDIAEATGRTRESVRLLVGGDRGPGGFPAPARSDQRGRLWRVADVAVWLAAVGDTSLVDVVRDEVAELNAAVNGALERARYDLGADARQALDELLAQPA